MSVAVIRVILKKMKVLSSNSLEKGTKKKQLNGQ